MTTVDLLSSGQFWLVVGFFALLIVVGFFVIKQALKEALIEADEEIQKRRERERRGGVKR